jgi:choline dehydrogenase-like flavoprotein
MSENNSFECVVIGSGFGGTIAAIVMANLFKERQKNETVCILERGQWWVSHEIPSRDRNTITEKEQNMREYLEDKDIPHDFWAHPDNIEGLFKLASMSRQLNRRGLYDLRTPNDSLDIQKHTISAITASGVGGGSLVYSNVTIRPPESVYRNWPTEKEGSLSNYFEIAEDFIGVSKITTISGVTNQKISRSLLFQNAAKNAKKSNPNILNNDGDFDLNLSITDIPDVHSLLSKEGPLKLEKTVNEVKELTPDEAKTALEKFELKYRKRGETNVCQRQGRCNLGCLPGARHTFNKKLFRAIKANKPLVVKALCEVYLIEYDENEQNPYTIYYKETKLSSNTDRMESILKKSIKARQLIIAGGSLSTTELLLKSAKRNDDKALILSNQLGKQFTTNADLLALAELKHKKVDITRGPINTSHVKFKTKDKDFAFNIEDTAIPTLVAGPLSILFDALFYQARNRRRPVTIQARLSWIRKYPFLFFMVFRGLDVTKIQRMLFKLWDDDKFRNALMDSFIFGNKPTKRRRRLGKESPLKRYYRIVNDFINNAEEPFASPSERLENYFAFSCMGVDKSNGELSLNEKWERIEEQNKLAEKLQLKWSPKENKEIFEEIISGVKSLAKEIDDSKVIPVGWDEQNPEDSQLVLLHPLGGCPMGSNHHEGVVNGYGEVFKPNGQTGHEIYPGLLVLDGSIIPSSPGVNPSLTISAIAIRCMEHLAQKLETKKGIQELLIDN